MPNIEISEEAFNYLQSKASPLVDTTVTVMDRLLEEVKRLDDPLKSVAPGLTMQFGPSNLPSVKFTTVTAAKIDNMPVLKKDWNHILEGMIIRCSDAGVSTEQFKSILAARVIEGAPSAVQEKRGFRHVASANISFQGLDAVRACKNIISLAEQFSISVEISIRWQEDEKAAHPGHIATLSFP